MATPTMQKQDNSTRAVPVANGVGEHYSPLPDQEKNGKVTAHAVQTIQAEPKALYDLWHDVSFFPRWQEHVISVTPTANGMSHWVIGDPEKDDPKRIEFDSRITEDVDGEKISWQSVDDKVEQSGTVTFVPCPSGRGTLVTLIQTVKVPMGIVGNAVAAVAERSPRQTVIENLRHFKQIVETGEIPTVKGQPHGPRGMSGSIKEHMFGETNPTPPGTSAENYKE